MRWKSKLNYPPGGWEYQSPGGAFVSAPSCEELIRKVSELESVEAPEAWTRIESYLCGRHPGLCSGAREAPKKAVTAAGGRNPLYLAVAAWLDRIFDKPADAPVASDGATHDRLARCTACPHARKPTFGCPRCDAAVITARRALTADRPERAHADTAPVCAAYGLDCLTAARHGIPASRRPPPGCWADFRGPDPTAVDTTVEQ